MSSRGTRAVVKIVAPAQLLCVPILILVTSTAFAVEIEHLEIDSQKSRYEVDMSFRVTAPPSTVIALLSDFGYPDRLNPDVTSKEVIFERNGVTRVRIGFRGCVLFFCKATSMTQDISVSGNEITADTVADGGDFKSGRLHWHVVDGEQGGTIVGFRATVEHETYVFPLIGKFFVRKRLRDQLLRTAENLEIEASR